MQATVNVSHTDLQRRVRYHTSHLFKFCGRLIPVLLPILIWVSLVRAQSTAETAVSQPIKPAAQSDAQKAFEKMKTLSGSWQGTIMRIPINFTIRPASSGTAILHEGHTSEAGPPKHEITMFYLDGDRLLGTHFCDAGNRSRFEGKMSPDGNAIEFSFLDVAGSTRGGYLKDIVITIIDADHHSVGFTFVMPDGKPIQLRGEFQRTK